MTDQSITVRTATSDDAHQIQQIYAPIVEQTVISFEDTVPTHSEMADRIAQTLASGYPYLVADVGTGLLGYAYAGLHRSRAAYRWSVDVTVYVSEDARGRGVGRALYHQLLPQLAERGFHAAFAGIALPNPSSIALREAVGFRPVGIYHEVGFKFGQWHDVGWWQRRL